MLRDDNRHLKEENAALKEEIERMRRLLFGSGSEKLEKGDWIVASEAQEQSQTEPNKPAEKPKESEGRRKPCLKVHLTRRVWHEMVPEEVQDAPEKYQRLPKSCDNTGAPPRGDIRVPSLRASGSEGKAGSPHPRESPRHAAARLHDGSERRSDGHPRQVRAAPAALPTDQRV